MSTPRISRKISAFNSYIRNSDNYLQLTTGGPPAIPNWERLGISEDAANGWHNARTEWDLLYFKYDNVDTRTKSVTASVGTAMETFFAFAQPLLDIMAASPNADDTDETNLNFKIGRSEPSHPTVPIAAECDAKTESMGQGLTKFICRFSEEGRPAMAEGANIIQVKIKIGGDAPTGPSDCPMMIILGKAIDTYNLGDENVGKRAYAYFRYFNTKYPALAGGYSEVKSFIIS